MEADTPWTRPTPPGAPPGQQKFVPTTRPLSDKMLVFANEYLTGAVTGCRFNATKAALHAVGPGKTDHQYSLRGYAWLRHPEVRKYIEKRLDEYSMSAGEVLARFTDIARSEAGAILEMDPTETFLKIDPKKVIQNRRFVKSFGYDANGNPKIEFHDALGALRDIAKVRGMLKEGLEVSGPGGGAVPVKMVVEFVLPNGEKEGPIQPALTEGEQPADGYDEEWYELEDD